MNRGRFVVYLLFSALLLFVALLGVETASWVTPSQSHAEFTVPTPTPSTVEIALKVTLQRPNAPPPNPSWAVPVHLAFYPPGDPNTISGEWDLVLNDSGQWPGGLAVAPGTYDVRVKNLHTLRNVKRKVVVSSAVTIDMGTLREGDADGDNRVRSADFALLRAAYFTTAGSPGFDPRTDFDEDKRIRSSDFALLRSNYFETGDIEVGAVSAVVAARASDGLVAVALEPSTLQTAPGEVITLTLMAHAGAQPFVSIDADIRFPADVLQVVGDDGQPATQIEPLGSLAVLVNSVDNNIGRVIYGAGEFGDPLSGDVAIARIHFRALRAAAQANVGIVDGSVSDSAGKFITGALSGSQVAVVPPGGFQYRYLPLILSPK